MMNFKKILFTMFVVCSATAIIAQQTTPDIKGGFLTLSAGKSLQNYQNLKAAPYQLSGCGYTYNFGWGKESEKSLWKVNMGFGNVDMKTSLSNLIKVNSKVVNVNVDYLHRIGNGKVRLFGGAGVNTSFNMFENDKLLNDQTSYNFLNTLMMRGAARGVFKCMGRNLQGEFSVGVGLIALGKDSKSFAFSLPQNFLEDGKFNYQGASDEVGNPFKNSQVMSIGKYRRIQTGVNFRLLPRMGKRHFWQVGYNWDYYSYQDVKNYRVTSGIHTINLSYNFMSHRKK